MVLLTCENLKKSYTEKTLITDVSMSIHETDKIGFVGVNGTGKSTLLKMVAGVLEPEGGEITRSRELKAGYLPQNPPCKAFSQTKSTGKRVSGAFSIQYSLRFC